MMQSFTARLQDPRPILLDGATGTELNRLGANTGLPLWSANVLLEAPHIIKQVHRDYLSAGAEVLTTNTFRTHRRSLERAGFGSRAKELTSMAVHIAKEAAGEQAASGGGTAWVAGSVAPLEDCYSPELVPPQKECLEEHAEMVALLTQAGADLILIETMNTVREAEAASAAARDCGLPFIVSFVLRTDGKLFSGEGLSEAVDRISPYGPVMLGVNCTPTTMISASLKELDHLTPLPVCGYGNIGHTDEITGWDNTDDVSPDEYANIVQFWTTLKLGMLGGCCGTGPDHIAALHELLGR